MGDRQDFTDADRGLIAPLPGPVRNAEDVDTFDPARFGFIGEDVPAQDTVNPSLWRQAQIITNCGLFKVVDGVYHVRNNDTGNLTIVDGPGGLVIIDCQTSVESAAQGLALFHEHVNDKPVVAVIYTHTHIDHYGGVKGVVDPADVASGKVPIVAPGTIASFDKFAIGENVVAGNAMSRRAGCAFGNLLDFGVQQFVSCGLAGGGVTGPMTVSYLSPTRRHHRDRRETRARRAGVRVSLRPGHRGAGGDAHLDPPVEGVDLCGERQPRSAQHPDLRGARTRDARNFARFLDETLQRWGEEAQVHYGPHTWPVWGNDDVVTFIESQRDTYKYIHDQALRLAR